MTALDDLCAMSVPGATVHYCDPPTMDHPLHRLVGMRRAGWLVLTKYGCIVHVYGPFATRTTLRVSGRVGWPGEGLVSPAP